MRSHAEHGNEEKTEEKPEPVLFSDDELVKSEDGEEPDEPIGPPAPDIFEAEQAVSQEEELMDQTTYIHEQILEETVRAGRASAISRASLRFGLSGSTFTVHG